MKQLICELCGSTDFLKQDGAFVCQSCGCKYSVEEARKMMVDGPVEVTGTVQVDHTQQKKEQVQNYLNMAKTALEGEDGDSVLTYCNKVLEIDTENYEAWRMIAMSAGWGSSLSNIKIPQSIAAGKRAINLAPEDLKSETALAIYLSVRLQIESLLEIAKSLPTGGFDYIHRLMYIWLSALQELPYLGTALIEADIEICADMCRESKAAILPGARAIFATYWVSNNKESYDVTFRKALAEKLQTEAAREKEQAEKTLALAEAYWAAHPEEKQELEAKKADLEAQRAEASAPIAAAEETVAQLTAKAKELSDQYAATSIFKFKESRAITAQMDENSKELFAAKKTLAEAQSSTKETLSAIDEQIAEIEKAFRTKH